MSSPAIEAAAWYRITYGYRQRDRQVCFGVHAADSGKGIDVLIPLGDLLAKSGITVQDCADAIGDQPVAEPDHDEDDDFEEARRAVLPPDLTGRTAIDVGGYDGRIARLLLERGAKRVRLIDNGEWISYGWKPPRLPEGISYIGCDILEWQEPADFIVCGNVLYHVRDPWRFLYHLRSLCKWGMVLWTSIVEGDEPVWRVMDYGDEQHGQMRDDYYTVFWKPTESGLLRLFERTGWVARIENRVRDHVIVRAVPNNQ